MPDATLEALYAAAQEEGTLMLYTSSPELQTQPHIDAFEAKYPGVEVEFIRLSTSELLQRFASESAAGASSADLLSAPDPLTFHEYVAAGSLADLAASGLPGGFPPSGYPEEFVAFDGEFGVVTLSPVGISYNTDLVDADQAPQTYEDVLDPAWAGAISAGDPAQSGASAWDFWDFLATTHGDDYLTSLRDADIDLSLLPVPAAQSLAAGESSVQLFTFANLTLSLQDEGAPVEFVIPDQTTAAQTYLGLVADGPHPNAARLFVQYTYSEEGAATLANTEGSASPYGGEGMELPPEYVAPRTAIANSPERKAELAALLGIEP